MFPYRNIQKYTRTSPDGKTHNQTDHILVYRRWHSIILDVQSFRKLPVILISLVFAKVRERLSARKKATQKTDVERFNLKQVSELEDTD
jgi:hypothetical protein